MKFYSVRIDFEIEDSEEISALKTTKEILDQIRAAMHTSDGSLNCDAAGNFYTEEEVAIAAGMIGMLLENDDCYID